MVRCIVLKVTEDEIVAKVLDKFIDPDNEIIYIDTTYSRFNPNSNFKNIPIGTYFTYKNGVINGVEKKLSK